MAAAPVQAGLARHAPAPATPRVEHRLSGSIALLGTFDVSNYGDLLFPAIFRHEMAARGIVDIASFSPLSAPFFSDRPDRCRAISSLRRSPCVGVMILGGGHLLHPNHGSLMRLYAALHRRVRLKLTLLNILGRLERYAGMPANLRTAKRKWELLFGYRCPIPLLPSPEHAPCNVALIVNACGAYGLPGRLDHRSLEQLRAWLNRALYLSVRDTVSAECLSALKLNNEITVVPDMALLLPNVFGDAPNRNALMSREFTGARHGGDYLVVQGGIDAAHASTLGGVLSSVSTVGKLEVILLPIRSWAKDLESLKNLAQFGAGHFHLVPRYLKPPEIAALIAGARGVVTNGLHSLVTAVAYGRPVLALPNKDAKISGFLQVLSLKTHQSISWDQVPNDLPRALAASPEVIQRAANQGRAALRTHFDRIAEFCSRTRLNGRN